MKNNIILVSLLVLSLLIPSTLLAWTGKVVHISDGDTAKIVRSDTGQQIKVRFAGIDAPEKKMPYGKAAKKFVASLIAGKNVRVEPLTIDRYGRTVGYIWLGDNEINLKIVAAGYAWMYRRYAPKPKSRAAEYERAEESARTNKLGLWNDPNPIPPWEWRRAKRNRHRR